MKRLILVLCIIMALIIAFSIDVFAASESFTRQDQQDGGTVQVLSREIYKAEQQITASSLGLDVPLDGLTDLCFGNDGAVYILCGKNNRLIVLNADYTLKEELTVTDDNNKIDFTGAEGIFVDSIGYIYIADTNNGRVIISDQSGQVKEIWEAPESSLIPEDFVYQPVSLIRDDKNYTYILSLGCFYGALTYSPDGEFLGFYGANTVSATVLDTLGFLWDKLTGNDIKRAQTAKKLPYSFVDLSLDSDGYMVVCTGVTLADSNGIGQIRKISPGGSDIMTKRNLRGGSTSSSGVNFLENNVMKKGIKTIPQSLTCIDVSKSGYIYALDETLGLIYVYDDSCNLIGTFGGGLGEGNRLGLFTAPQALAVFENSVLVADYSNKSITVFTLTEYGRLLQTAQTLYLMGEYGAAESYWNQILLLDSGNQLAYRGLAIVSYNEGDYKAALEYAKRGLDYSVYDLAYQNIIKGFIQRNFVLISGIVVLLVGCLIVLITMIKKRKKVLIKNPVMSTITNVMFHPFQSFNNVKYKGHGSLVAGFVLMGLFYIVTVLQSTCSGFLFSNYSAKTYNTFYAIVQTAGILLLWSVINWLVAALFSGKGTLKEVFIVSSYSLLPLILYTFLRFALSHVITLSGMEVMDGIYVAVLIFTFFLISIGMITIHEYNFFKFISTSILTIFGMLLVVFILFVIIIQIQQLVMFINSVFMEVVYR